MNTIRKNRESVLVADKDVSPEVKPEKLGTYLWRVTRIYDGFIISRHLINRSNLWRHGSWKALYSFLSVELLALCALLCPELPIGVPFSLHCFPLCFHRNTEKVSGVSISGSEVLQWLQTSFSFQKGTNNTTGRCVNLRPGDGFPAWHEIIPQTREIRPGTFPCAQHV